jgi:dTDP-glucose 4,6-dehydratase
VLVTGGAGFLGGHLCEALLARNLKVVCVDNLSTSSGQTAERLADVPGYRFVNYDISQSRSARGNPIDLDGLTFDTVFHLASPASPVDYLRMPTATLQVGASGSKFALDIAQHSGARFVLASTSEVYGDPLEHPQRETYWGNVNPIGPRSVYDESKRYAEALTFAYCREKGLSVGVARIFNTYGPRMRVDDGRVVPTFCAQALAGLPMTVAGRGTQTRSLCYVDDTVAGLIALAESDFAGPVNIGNPVELTVLRIAEEIRILAGSNSPIEFIEPATDDPKRRCPDIELARERLGWEPWIGYRQGLELTLDWFRKLPLERGETCESLV